jgi:hypothetical protein
VLSAYGRIPNLMVAAGMSTPGSGGAGAKRSSALAAVANTLAKAAADTNVLERENVAEIAVRI